MRLALSEIPLGSTRASIAAFVRNLTQEDRPTNFIDFGPGFGGLTLGYFPDPRTWGATVGIEF
jgi:iron complex outermembrane receptor protein